MLLAAHRAVVKVIICDSCREAAESLQGGCQSGYRKRRETTTTIKQDNVLIVERNRRMGKKKKGCIRNRLRWRRGGKQSEDLEWAASTKVTASKSTVTIQDGTAADSKFVTQTRDRLPSTVRGIVQ